MVEGNAAGQSGEPGQEAGRRRERAAIEFPYADLARSADLTATLGQAGGKIWIEQSQLAVALDMSVTGGTFRSHLSAAKMFGFVETDGGKVRLSDLGIRLLDESSERAAKVDAFLNVPLYRAMYDGYNGFALPPPAAVERQMVTFGVPPKQAERARQAFTSSAQAAGYIASNGRFSKPMITPADAPDDIPKGGNGGGTPPPPPAPPPPAPPPPPPPPEKLEYKLVDLMSEALDKPEVMQAIITVVTFLKARDAEKKTGVDQ